MRKIPIDRFNHPCSRQLTQTQRSLLELNHPPSFNERVSVYWAPASYLVSANQVVQSMTTHEKNRKIHEWSIMSKEPPCWSFFTARNNDECLTSAGNGSNGIRAFHQHHEDEVGDFRTEHSANAAGEENRRTKSFHMKSPFSIPVSFLSQSRPRVTSSSMQSKHHTSASWSPDEPRSGSLFQVRTYLKFRDLQRFNATIAGTAYPVPSPHPQRLPSCRCCVGCPGECATFISISVSMARDAVFPLPTVVEFRAALYAGVNRRESVC